MPHELFSRDPALAAVVRPAVLWWDDARVVEQDPRLEAALVEAEGRLRGAPPEPSPAVRVMYRRLGIDPTKTRPSSEALLRRIRRGESLPRVNSAVDVINWASVEFQLPYGLYDRDRIEGPVTLRRGRPGEEYAGIRKDTVHVAGRMTLVDCAGPFGNPTSDSARTMVTAGTTSLLVVIYAPADLAAPTVGLVLDTTAGRLTDFAGGREVHRLSCA